MSIVSCPNNCSQNGQCVSIYELSLLQEQDIPSRVSFIYGSGSAMNTKAWDYQTMYGCVCASVWSVGFAAGQTQLSEFFGPDCSLSKFTTHIYHSASVIVCGFTYIE